MSEPLEDYLETIYLLVQESGFARVRDIAKTRGVKAATVSIALRKLAEAGLVNYTRREYIGLTEKGHEAGRRILARHRLLTRFFEEVLGMSRHAAGEQACHLEHALTDEAMDRMVRFFEFLGSCPSVVQAFNQCPMGIRPGQASACGPPAEMCASCSFKQQAPELNVASLESGQRGIVTQITASGGARQKLLDMGILPETAIDVEAAGFQGQPVWIRCQGARLPLTKVEAGTIRVRRPR